MRKWRILLSALLVVCLLPLGSFAIGDAADAGEVDVREDGTEDLGFYEIVTAGPHSARWLVAREDGTWEEFFCDEEAHDHDMAPVIEQTDVPEPALTEDEVLAMGEKILAEMVAEGWHPVYWSDAYGNEQWLEYVCDDEIHDHAPLSGVEQTGAEAAAVEDDFLVDLIEENVHIQGAYVRNVIYDMQCNTPVPGFCSFTEYDYYRCNSHVDCYIGVLIRSFTAPHDRSAWSAPEEE